LLSMFVMPHLPTWGRLVLGACIVLCYWLVFFCLLETPWVDARNSHSVLPVESNLNVRSETFESAGQTGEPVAMKDRLKLQARLMKYVLPLVIVYWAEYAAQAGAWTSFAIPAHELQNKDARNTAYQWFNLFYQIGVLVSRSSGKLFNLSVTMLWVVSFIQIALLVFFVIDGVEQFWQGVSLILPAFVVGLMGGTNYVQTCLAIDREVRQDQRELALSTVSVGSPIGILLADVTGLVIQWCLFQANQIESSHEVTCPF